MRLFFIATMLATATMCGAQEKKTEFTPEIHGTVRAKYEYQTEEGEGRFEVRNARISISGKVVDAVSYKAEVDLSD